MARPSFLIVALALSFSSAFLSGCTQLDFGSHESFDAWYVAREDGVQVDQLGVSSLDGNILGFLLNDVAIRTPLALVQEVAYLSLTPVALPYYWIRFATRGERARPSVEASGDDSGERESSGRADATSPDAPHVEAVGPAAEPDPAPAG